MLNINICFLLLENWYISVDFFCNFFAQHKARFWLQKIKEQHNV